MRLLEREKRTVTLKAAVTRTNKYTDTERLYRYDNTSAQAIRAVVQPLSGHTAALVYGQGIGLRKRMLYDGEATVALGMGVCVDVDASAPCDYRVEELPTRYGDGHIAAVLVYIPPEQRGV